MSPGSSSPPSRKTTWGPERDSVRIHVAVVWNGGYDSLRAAGKLSEYGRGLSVRFVRHNREQRYTGERENGSNSKGEVIAPLFFMGAPRESSRVCKIFVKRYCNSVNPYNVSPAPTTTY